MRTLFTLPFTLTFTKTLSGMEDEHRLTKKKPLLLSMDIGVWLKEIENVSLQQSAKPLQTEIITINAFLA